MNGIYEAAKSEFESAATAYFVETLNILTKARPNAKWGYYGLPINLLAPCEGDRQDMKCGYDSSSGDLYRSFSDKQKPIWQASTALYPSVYFQPFRTTFENIAYVQSVINETVRCFNGKIPVFAFHWNYYHNATTLLDPEDLFSGLVGPYDQKSQVCGEELVMADACQAHLMLVKCMKASPLREIQKEKEPLQLQDNKVFFIESICDDEDVIAENIKQVKLCSPDYKEQDPEEAVKDFQMRIKNYEIRYETLDHVEDNTGERAGMKASPLREIQKEKEPLQLQDNKVFDATNSTRERRQLIIDHCIPSCIKVFFIESICDDDDVIAENIKQVKLCSPDYKEQDPEEAVKDFQMRIKNYEIRYETLDHVEDKWVICACFLMKFEYSNNY
ncbi:hypothetical protein EMCRGX_G034784 [Ephydatia muelleri]